MRLPYAKGWEVEVNAPGMLPVEVKRVELEGQLLAVNVVVGEETLSDLDVQNRTLFLNEENADKDYALGINTSEEGFKILLQSGYVAIIHRLYDHGDIARLYPAAR